MKKIYTLLVITLLSTSIYAQWNQLGSDVDGESAGDYSGRSVSISADGMTMAVGATGNSGNGIDAGHVRVYKLIAGMWTQQGADIDGESAADRSGIAVSISADGLIVAIGGYENSGNGFYAGHVRVFKFSLGTWVQLGVDIDGEVAYDFSGESVSLSADGLTVAIGADGNDGNGFDAGHVRVYKFISGTWVQQGADIDGESAGDESGFSVSLSNDGLIVAIGAFGNVGNGSTSGQVRVYKLISGVWIQQGIDLDGEAAGPIVDESICVSLSADGLTVAIGASANDGNGVDAGHVRVYQFISGVWTQQGVDIDGESAGDQSGNSVSLSDDGLMVAIGALGNNENGFYAGHVRVYRFISGVWTQQGLDIDGEATSDVSGGAVSLSADGSTVAIGAYGNDGNGNNAGHVRVYSMPTVSISEEKSLFQEVTIFPNPSKGIVTINLGDLNKASIKVFSIYGQLIHQQENISEPLLKFELNEASGLYFIEINAQGQIQQYPLMIN